MGEKNVSLHFRTDSPDRYLEMFREIFDKGRLSEENLAVLRILKKFMDEKNSSAKEPAEETDDTDIKEFFQDTQLLLDPQNSERALLVQRRHFISLYWNGCIHMDNLDDILYSYAKKTSTPLLAAAFCDESGLLLWAIRAQDGAALEECRIPIGLEAGATDSAAPATLCRILDAPFLLAALQNTLDCTDKSTMAETFEKNTGIGIFMDTVDCLKAGMKEKAHWSGADVFADIVSAKKFI